MTSKLEGEITTYQERLVFSGQSLFFADHFPGFPLVPAFIQLEAIRKEVLKWQVPRRNDGGVCSIRMSKVKFLGPIGPDEECVLELQCKSGANSVQFRILGHGELKTSGEVCIA